MMKIEYSSNNSGGSWWMNDNDWINLEKAGWYVIWGGLYFCNSKWNFRDKPYDLIECIGECKDGHRVYNSHTTVTKRCVGALAAEAYKDFHSPKEAMEEFEKITGQKVTDEGCNCCGGPHTFRWEGGYASGAGCLEYLFPGRKIPENLREAMELK